MPTKEVTYVICFKQSGICLKPSMDYGNPSRLLLVSRFVPAFCRRRHPYKCISSPSLVITLQVPHSIGVLWHIFNLCCMRLLRPGHTFLMLLRFLVYCAFLPWHMLLSTFSAFLLDVQPASYKVLDISSFLLPHFWVVDLFCVRNPFFMLHKNKVILRPIFFIFFLRWSLPSTLFSHRSLLLHVI